MVIDLMDGSLRWMALASHEGDYAIKAKVVKKGLFRLETQRVGGLLGVGDKTSVSRTHGRAIARKL